MNLLMVLNHKVTKSRGFLARHQTILSLAYGVCPFVDALDDFLLPKPKILKPLPPATACAAAVVLPFPDAATTSGLDPFLAAKSWKLIGGAEALRGLLE